MKSIVSVLFLSSVLVVAPFAGQAFADVDDEARIAKCLDDNDDEGQTDDALMTYCTCANEKMSSYESTTITEWEKAHADEQEQCSKQAGWKSTPD